MATPTPLPPFQVIGGDGSTWEEIPISSAEFFKTFLNEPLFPLQQEFMDAMLGTDPLKWDTTYQEGLALWGKGSGKDRTAAKCLLYCAYVLLCMKSPQSFLGKPPTDKIEMVNVCINARLANTVFFKYFTSLVRATKNPKTGKNWFVEKGMNLSRDIKKREVEFPKSITAFSLDSEEYTAEGYNVLIAIFDEIAGFDVKTADQLYKALYSSALSRYPKHMKIILLSYKRSDDDYMMKRFEISKQDPTVFRHGPFATWEVNLNQKESDFAQAYINDPETSERTYQCIGETNEGGFIKHKSRISHVINASLVENPILGDIIATNDLGSLRFKDWFKPIPFAEYFIHVDLAKGQEGGDKCGFAMCHYDKNMVVDIPESYIEALLEDHKGVLKREDILAQIGQKRVGVVLDLVLQISAPAKTEIMFEDIRTLIDRLRRLNKFPIYKVTYDQFQSFDSIALLKKAGVNADEQSVDKDDRAYKTLKKLIYEGLLKSYQHKILVRELEGLIVTKTGKVDHPVGSTKRYMEEDKIDRGSKDVADAVAGAVALAIDRGKGGFSFGPSTKTGSVGARPNTSPGFQNPAQTEQEKLVRYGEKPIWGHPAK